MRALWIPTALRTAGLDVVEVPGWRTRGEDALLPIEVVVCHHTGTPLSTKHDLPTLDTLIHGRNDLAGPLCQVGLGYSGTVYVIASGKANHAGVGRWGKTQSSRRTLGIEAESPGDGTWTPQQRAAYPRVAAALLAHEARPYNDAAGHAEWALPEGRKIDPVGIDMDAFRAEVGVIMNGGDPMPAPEPTKLPPEDYMNELVIDENSVQYIVGPTGVFQVSSMKAVDAFHHFGYIRPGAPRRVTKAWVNAMARAVKPVTV